MRRGSISILTAAAALQFACASEESAGSGGADGSSSMSSSNASSSGDSPTEVGPCGEEAPSPEVCDNEKDDDCDGEIDEELCLCEDASVRSCGEAEGQCVAGTQACIGGVWGPCEGVVAPSDEVCDGLDNDCDGVVDDAPQSCQCLDGAVQVCGTDEGECVAGTQTCGDGQWGACVGALAPMPEVCDGLDNDCDGLGDNLGEGTCDCVNGAQQACGSDEGSCVVGVQVCAGGHWGACDGIGPTPEECDGEDDDCDGVVDQGVLNACGQCGPVPDEVCDGLDNDCDGVKDDGVLNACGKCGPVPSEVCDDVDNDCDGVIDDGVSDCGLEINVKAFTQWGGKTVDYFVPKPAKSKILPMVLIDEYDPANDKDVAYDVKCVDTGPTYKCTVMTHWTGDPNSFLRGRIALIGIGTNGDMVYGTWAGDETSCNSPKVLSLPAGSGTNYTLVGSSIYDTDTDDDYGFKVTTSQIGNDRHFAACGMYWGSDSDSRGIAALLDFPASIASNRVLQVNPTVVKNGKSAEVFWPGKTKVIPLLAVSTYDTKEADYFGWSITCGAQNGGYLCTTVASNGNADSYVTVRGILVEMP